MANTSIQTIDSAVTVQPSGRAMLDGGECLCGDEIKAGDLVLADFDRTTVSTGGGLYLFQSADGWRGCCRMMRTPDGIAIDQDGRGAWKTVPRLSDSAWRIVGTVETVYRPNRVG